MSNQLTPLAGGQLVAPANMHGLMGSLVADEMQSNVTASFAVVTIKGKVFGIKHGGKSTPITMTMNGQLYAAPYFDVVIPRAKAELSKTWYPTGYTDGSDEQPTCWSEDGVNPLAPLAQRPIDDNTGAHCVDCRGCPMNRFGSRVSDSGGRGKACADTRKIIVVPVDANGAMDGDNIKYGGPMLLRVPAASLRPFAEYSQKLQQMGLAYFSVVTRMQFDPAEAYPKFVLAPVRSITDAEADKVIEIRDSLQTMNILAGDQTGAPIAPSHQLAGPTPVPMQAAPAATTPAPVVTPQMQVVPSNVVPLQQPPAPVAAPVQMPAQTVEQLLQPAPVQTAPTPAPLAPLPPQAPPAASAEPVMLAKANGVSYAAFKGNNWSDEQLIAEGYMQAPLPAVPQAPPAPPVAPAVPSPPPLQMAPAAPLQPAPVAAAPVGAGPVATPALLNIVDSLLAG